MTGRRVLHGKKGQSLVETALVLPIIILLLMGIIDFGLIFNNYQVISNASREGARSAATGITDEEIRTVVEGVATTLDLSKLNVDIEPTEDIRKKGDEVTVTVKYNYDVITPVIAAIIPHPLELSGKTVMRVE